MEGCYTHVPVCVCVRERERERQMDGRLLQIPCRQEQTQVARLQCHAGELS
jgi:hypothetical protein